MNNNETSLLPLCTFLYETWPWTGERELPPFLIIAGTFEYILVLECWAYKTKPLQMPSFLMTKFTAAISPTINNPWVRMTDKLWVIFHNLSLFLYADSVDAETAVLSARMVMTPDSRAHPFITAKWWRTFHWDATCTERKSMSLSSQVNVHILNYLISKSIGARFKIKMLRLIHAREVLWIM